MELLTEGTEISLTLLWALDPFSLTGLHCRAIMEGVPSPTTMSYAKVDWYPWEDSPFQRRKPELEDGAGGETGQNVT